MHEFFNMISNYLYSAIKKYWTQSRVTDTLTSKNIRSWNGNFEYEVFEMLVFIAF